MNSSRARLPDEQRAASQVLAAAGRDLFHLGRNDLALPVARMAVQADPSFGNAHSVMAGVLDSFGDHDPALHHWREAARLMPGVAQQQLNHALAVLGGGDWQAGLSLYESRLDAENWLSAAAAGSVAAVRAQLPHPATALAGRKILALTEQGLGDAIWSVRFLRLLGERGADVTLATTAALRPLLERVTPTITLLSPPVERGNARIDIRMVAGSFDHFLPTMSLPWILGIRPRRTDRGNVPYLIPDTDAVAEWRARYRQALPHARRIVGIIWRVNPAGPAAATRSLAVTDLVPLADLEGIGFVNLQGGAPEGRSSIATVLPRVHDPLAASGGAPPLDRFAAAIAATDILVTVDTMGAHLAGAMDHPAIVLMPTAPAPAFYWGHRGDRSIWYPSLRLLRQAAYFDWRAPIATLRSLLAEASAA